MSVRRPTLGVAPAAGPTQGGAPAVGPVVGPAVGLALVLAVALALGLAGCGASATLGPAIPAVGGAPQEQRVVLPRVGQCRELSADALGAASDATPPVSCSAAHNALTFYVGRLGGDPVDFPRTARTQCDDRTAKAVGLSTDELALTMIGGAYYYPTAREYALGATYVRCDLVPSDGVSTTAPPLPAGSSIPLFPSLAAVPQSLRRCRDATDDRPCTRPHVWRATGAFRVTGGGRQRPSIGFFRRRERRHCPQVVTTDRYYWTSPSQISWSNGDRTVVCFSRSRR